MDETREAAVMSTFAALADTLVDDYDVVELLQTLVDACRDILGHTAAGILLADESGQLELIASTSEASREVELMQIAAASGRASSASTPADASPSPRSPRRPRDGRASASAH